MIIHDDHNDMVVEQLLFGPNLKRAWSLGSYIPGTAAIRAVARDMDQGTLSATTKLMADMDCQFLSVYRVAMVVAEMAASLITELGAGSSDLDLDDYQKKSDMLLQALAGVGRSQAPYLQGLSSRLRKLVKSIGGSGALHAVKSEKRWWIQESHSIADEVAVVLLNVRATCDFLNVVAAEKEETSHDKDGNNNGDKDPGRGNETVPPTTEEVLEGVPQCFATHADVMEVKQAVEDLMDAQAAGKKPRRKRKAKDVLAFCVRVDELVKPKNGASMQLKDAIKKAWDENIALPRNASYVTRWRDYDHWTSLKQQLDRNPTVREYEDAMPPIGRPPKVKPLT